VAGVKPGERLRCDKSGTEVVVIKAGGEALRCCGPSMVIISHKVARAS
jgi:hypothetical protein